ncbi:signal peptidase I [Enterococcus faecium]|uniref:Signal peptidase I n=1 Tax=Enterococcus faecium TaxID=1352 RepID=A0A7V7GLK0_ENTFC|nr:signal peptidase I [Enterococcus faecium]EGP5687578.1 signal peptidase I [Enterococcus faecium]EME8085536.1 signal peptidase I [Enterococcus faecium]EME8197334.1 signal peptidase I [Enterococcus faecium]KAA0689649.1 signal peptidase I [Enterococcus faecium]MBK5027793.1 signal peptidase I [Enterococcus faecium]
MTKKQRYIDRFWLIFKYLLVSVFIAFMLRGFLFIPVPVEGNSMENVLKQGDMVVMEKFSEIRRFDIVVFQLADGTIYIKRVIGLPGENVSYQNDQLKINGKVVKEPYLTKNMKSDHANASYTTDFILQELTGQSKLPEDSYFVLGDNRRVSKDSRSFGTINKTDILGKARFVYYPLDEIKWIQ